MTSEIGDTAGKVWHLLNENGESTVAQLKKKLGGTTEQLHQAIGWLAREDKIVLNKKGTSLKVALK